MVLLMVKDVHALIDNSVIRSIIHMMVISNVLAIGYRLITENNRLWIMNNYVRIDKFKADMSPLYSWLYVHKCQYAFILLLCIAFFVIHRKSFCNLFTYLLSLGVLIFALYLSDTYTSMAAAALIFVGQFMDYLCKTKWWKKLIAAVLIGIPGCIGFNKLYEIISVERNLSTLGSRTLIWKVSIEHIVNNPNGLFDFIMGVDTYKYFHPKLGYYLYAYNCHNVFLIYMFRFSILVGGIFLSIIILLFLISLKRKPSFLTLCIWIAFFISWSMDYSMTCSETTISMLIFFLLFFIPKKEHAVA